MEENINGQIKCEKCGSTDISQNPNTGKLRCNFCRHEFEQIKSEKMNINIEELEGLNISNKANNIKNDENLITLKCSSCGAEVVINTENSTQARCHWCRNTLSINDKVENGAVPDVILPFSVNKKEAKECIENYVGKRKFFAHKEFTDNFSTDNVMGFYLPYMIVDANEHVTLSGQAEKNVKIYSVKRGKTETTYYDADVYDVKRNFDAEISGLTIESSSDKINNITSEKTNNIINAIMPFDTKNAVEFDSNYLKGFTSEKRDMNLEEIKPIVDEQIKDIARYKMNETTKKYDRGVRWDTQDYDIKGENWNTAYLPVWLYGYKDNKKLHYVAVNGRTKETEGSVPLDKKKLSLTSIGIGTFLLLFLNIILPIISGVYNMISTNASGLEIHFGSDLNILAIIVAVGFYAFIYIRYTRINARHIYEKETNILIKNLDEYDKKVGTKKKQESPYISGRNDLQLHGKTFGNGLTDVVTKGIKDFIK